MCVCVWKRKWQRAKDELRELPASVTLPIATTTPVTGPLHINVILISSDLLHMTNLSEERPPLHRLPTLVGHCGGQGVRE